MLAEIVLMMTRMHVPRMMVRTKTLIGPHIATIADHDGACIAVTVAVTAHMMTAASLSMTDTHTLIAHIGMPSVQATVSMA